MRISNIRSRCEGGAAPVKWLADVEYDDRPGAAETLWFEFPADVAGSLDLRGDPWLVAMLPLAARLGKSISIEAPVDEFLLDGARELMDWWRYWDPAMHVVPIPSAGVAAAPSADLRTAQFFSGGVDSFFTLLRHMEVAEAVRVDDLLVGLGFDIPLRNADAFDRVVRSLGKVAVETNRRLLPFATNIRETRFGELPWGSIGHGAAMAAVSLLLQSRYRRVLIPATDGYRETGLWGSHVTTDHLYSTSRTRLIHDGAAFSRLDKVRLISSSPLALSSLRVCWRSQSDVNCGRCEKCLRTMLALEICGVLARTRAFGGATLDLAAVRRIHCPLRPTGSLRLYYDEMYRAARKSGDLRVARALSSALRRSTMREIWLKPLERLADSGRFALSRRTYAALSHRLIH